MDSLRGGGGNDTLNGGLGSDLVLVSGLSADYLVEDLGGGQFRVTDSVGGRDGVDLLNGVENIRFSNGTTVTLSSLVVAPAPLPGSKAEVAAFVLPGLTDDDFLFGKGTDQPFVQPGVEQEPVFLAKDADVPVVLVPGFGDDDFLLSKAADEPLVLPGQDDLFGLRADLFSLTLENPLVINGPGGLILLQEPVESPDGRPSYDPWG